MAGTLGVVLSGGASRRFGGGNKALALLSETPLIAWVLERLKRQVDAVAINANGETACYEGLGYPVFTDAGPAQDGPVAGILAALRYAAQFGFRDVMTVPCDAPLIPADLAERLCAARGPAPCAFAMVEGKLNPVFALYRTDLCAAVVDAFDKGIRAPRELADLLDANFAVFTGEEARALADIDTSMDLAMFLRSRLAN